MGILIITQYELIHFTIWLENCTVPLRLSIELVGNRIFQIFFTDRLIDVVFQEMLLLGVGGVSTALALPRNAILIHYSVEAPYRMAAYGLPAANFLGESHHGLVALLIKLVIISVAQCISWLTLLGPIHQICDESQPVG